MLFENNFRSPNQIISHCEQSVSKYQMVIACYQTMILLAFQKNKNYSHSTFGEKFKSIHNYNDILNWILKLKIFQLNFKTF